MENRKINNVFNFDARGMEKIRDYNLDNKLYAKEVIETFNKVGLLEAKGKKYKRAYYPEFREGFIWR